MTVENQTNKKRFICDGIVDNVDFQFRVFKASDIKFYVYPEDLDFDDLDDYLVSTSDYTVTLNLDNTGGELDFDPSIAPAGYIGMILNLLDLTQTADLPTEGNFNEEAVETALDRMVAQNIQQQERINRGVCLRDEDPLATDTFEGFFIEAVEPADRANRVLAFNATGDGLVASAPVESLDIISGIADEIVIVANIAPQVVIVANNMTAVTTVSASIAGVNVVAGSIGNVNIAATNIAAINNVSTNMAAVLDAVANMSAIVAAPTYAALSQAWATQTASPVSGGLYGAKYYAEAAAAAAPQSNWSANRDPLATDDINAGYAVQSYWVRTNVSPYEAWICVASTPGAAVWLLTTLTIDELTPLLDAKQDLNPRVQSAASGALTPTSANDLCIRTALSAALTINNPTGTMVQGQALMIRLKDNGTARAITWGANYRGIGAVLPTTTVINKTMYIAMVWNSTDTKYDVTGVALET